MKSHIVTLAICYNSDASSDGEQTDLESNTNKQLN